MGAIETKEANNKLQIFKNEEFGEVRTIQNDKEILFVAKDICEKFGDTNYRRSVGRLEETEKTKLKIETNSGLQEMVFINESGLYSLLFYMQPQKAKGVSQNDVTINKRIDQLKKFKHWVTSEVLPQIRKHGMYATNELLDNPDLAIHVFQELKQEREKRKQLEAKQEQDKPLLDFAECVSNSSDCISISALAKLISNSGFTIGQNRLFEYLRNNKYLMNKNGKNHNVPYQEYIDMRTF